jgi:acetolactate synthase regulatory subunit
LFTGFNSKYSTSIEEAEKLEKISRVLGLAKKRKNWYACQVMMARRVASGVMKKLLMIVVVVVVVDPLTRLLRLLLMQRS